MVEMHAAGSTGSKASRKQRKSFATPGANGKLLPGEKARLKRARVDAKRAARSVGQGFNAASVVHEIESFVEAEGDIKVSRMLDELCYSNCWCCFHRLIFCLILMCSLWLELKAVLHPLMLSRSGSQSASLAASVGTIKDTDL